MRRSFSDIHRIAVIGCAGSGKSTLAARLHALTGLRLVSLDNLFWQKNSSPTPSERRAIVQQLLETPEWIIDGNDPGTYDLRLPTADVVVFLDPGLRECLLNLAHRAVQKRFSGPDLPAATKQTGFSLALIRYVLRFHRRDHRELSAAVRDLVKPERLIILTSRRDVNTLLIHAEVSGRL